MKLTFETGGPRYTIPRTALLAGMLLVTLGVCAAALPGIENGPVICPFRTVTGHPCPTCGLLRSAHWLMRGEAVRAVTVNPLDTVFLLAVAPALACLWAANLKRGLSVKLRATRVERRALWTLLAAAALANWAYVLSTHA